MRRPDVRMDARRLRYDTRTGDLYVNGERLPFFLTEDGLQLEPMRNDTVCTVSLLIFASEVCIDGEAGTPEYDRLLRERHPMPSPWATP